MKNASGLLLICPSTNTILLGLRESPESVWGVFGGMVELNESYIKCAKREMFEEAGFIENIHYHIASTSPLFSNRYSTFTYRCYCAIVKDELSPTLNHEHSEYGWFNLNQLPSPLHDGLTKNLVKNSVINKINNYLNSSLTQ